MAMSSYFAQRSCTVHGLASSVLESFAIASQIASGRWFDPIPAHHKIRLVFVLLDRSTGRDIAVWFPICMCLTTKGFDEHGHRPKTRLDVENARHRDGNCHCHSNLGLEVGATLGQTWAALMGVAMRRIALVLAFMVALVAPAVAQKAKIEAVNAKWMELFNKGDFDGVAQLYTIDAVAFPPGSSMVRGRAAIGTMWKAMAEQVTEGHYPRRQAIEPFRCT